MYGFSNGVKFGLVYNVFSLKLFIFSLIYIYIYISSLVSLAFNQILSIFSVILFVLSQILHIFSLVLFTFSQILYIFSLVLFVFGQILYIFSLIVFLFSHILYIYSFSSYFTQSSFLYSVSHTVREDVVLQILSCSRFRNIQIEIRKRQIKNTNIHKIEY